MARCIRSMKLLIIGFAALASVSGVWAEQTPPAAGRRIVLGLGTMSCETWMKATSRNRDVEHVTWTLGYLSGVGSSDASMRAVSESYVLGRIVGHCQSRPTDTIEAATSALVATLKP